MTALRCTAKLLKRLGIRDPGEPPPPENRLGSQFANVLYTRHGHFVLLVSERSLLPVLTTARDLDNLVPRFMRHFCAELGARQDGLGMRSKVNLTPQFRELLGAVSEENVRDATDEPPFKRFQKDIRVETVESLVREVRR